MAHLVLFPILLLLMALTANGLTLDTSSSGITRQLEQMLPNNERITRSIHSPIEEYNKPIETIPAEDANPRHIRSANSYDLQAAENNVVFRPLFRKKPKRVLRSTQDNEDLTGDLATAENHVFKPLFRRRPSKRLTRSLTEDMQTAENNIVFRPQFRRKPLRRVRSLRDSLNIPENHSLQKETEKRNNPFKIEEKSYEQDDSDYEDGVVDEVAEASSHFVKRDVQNDELMQTAANTIVFRPLFRTNRRNFNRQRS